MKLFRTLKAFLYRNVTASDRLTQAIEAHTRAEVELIRVTRSAESAITQLPSLLEEVRRNTKYVADSERSALQRAGHRHEF